MPLAIANQKLAKLRSRQGCDRGVCVALKHHNSEFLSAHARKMAPRKTATK
jgi:hypothetical protein